MRQATKLKADVKNLASGWRRTSVPYWPPDRIFSVTRFGQRQAVGGRTSMSMRPTHAKKMASLTFGRRAGNRLKRAEALCQVLQRTLIGPGPCSKIM